MTTKPEPPTIHLYVHDDTDGEALAPLLLGVEEEGVPLELHRHTEANPLKLANRAAISSRLGLGIGVSFGYVVITTEKLPEGRPYIAQFFGRDRHDDRAAGSNAARMVKRIPLRFPGHERNP